MLLNFLNFKGIPQFNENNNWTIGWYWSWWSVRVGEIKYKMISL